MLSNDSIAYKSSQWDTIKQEKRSYWDRDFEINVEQFAYSLASSIFEMAMEDLEVQAKDPYRPSLQDKSILITLVCDYRNPEWMDKTLRCLVPAARNLPPFREWEDDLLKKEPSRDPLRVWKYVQIDQAYFDPKMERIIRLATTKLKERFEVLASDPAYTDLSFNVNSLHSKNQSSMRIPTSTYEDKHAIKVKISKISINKGDRSLVAKGIGFGRRYMGIATLAVLIVGLFAILIKRLPNRLH